MSKPGCGIFSPNFQNGRSIMAVESNVLGCEPMLLHNGDKAAKFYSKGAAIGTLPRPLTSQLGGRASRGRGAKPHGDKLRKLTALLPLKDSEHGFQDLYRVAL